MHQTRRRKKRLNYGIKTVELSRGRNGFGFTISGQAPCILSCIVTGSPAERAGLRPGDYLIGVNGHNASKALHDDVVRLIGTSTGVLKLQVSENYYSDSSDDEIIGSARSKPKYPHRLRHRYHQTRAEKVVEDLRTGALFQETQNSFKKDAKDSSPGEDKSLGREPRSRRRSKTPKANRDSSIHSPRQKVHSRSQLERWDRSNDILVNQESIHSLFTEQELNSILHPVEPKCQVDTLDAVLRVVVGYLGTIEMPKDSHVQGSRLQAIRNCIRRLRVEKKVHTLVLMSIFPEKILLSNPHGLKIAEYPAERITFCGVYADDKKFFGLVTVVGNSSDEFSEGSQDEPSGASSSCHVFMVEPRMHSHADHIKCAKAFHIECSFLPDLVCCQEFPESADPVLQTITSLYRNRHNYPDMAPGLIDVNAHASPQPSTSSSNSSNSDSGIGFKDEGQQSDRVFVVDVENNNMRIQHFNGDESHIVRLQPVEAGNSSRDCSIHPKGRESPVGEARDSLSELDRLTVRAMPDPVSFTRSTGTVAANIRSSLHKYLQSKKQHLINVSKHINKMERNSSSANKRKNERQTPGFRPVKELSKKDTGEYVDLASYKLSPKVYGLPFPPNRQSLASDRSVTRSLEDIRDRSSGMPTQEGSESDTGPGGPGTGMFQGIRDRWMTPLARFIHGSETNISHYSQQFPSSPSSLHDLRSATCDHFPIFGDLGRPPGLRLLPSESGSQGDDVIGNQGEAPDGNPDNDIRADGSGEGGVATPLTKPWDRKSLKRQKPQKTSSHHHDAAKDTQVWHYEETTYSEDTRSVGSTGTSKSERTHSSSSSKVTKWAECFDNLVKDPAGLHAFADFLKSEFSAENVYFWAACRRFQLEPNTTRQEAASQIWQQYLSPTAQEPVNVDANARQMAQDKLQEAPQNTFELAEQQIYKLMKLDSYSRFLKSPLYQEFLQKEERQESLYSAEGKDPKLALSPGALAPNPKLKKSKSDAAERQRRSLIPWHRTKVRSRSKSRDRDAHSETAGSRSSLASSDLQTIGRRLSDSRESLKMYGGEGVVCRVELPDRSFSIVVLQRGQSISSLISGLLEKRSLKFSAWEIFFEHNDTPIDTTRDASILACHEVRVEQRILLKVEMPSKYCFTLQAKPQQRLQDLVKRELSKQGLRIDQVTAVKGDVLVNMKTLAAELENEMVVLHTKDQIHDLKRQENVKRKVSTGVRCVNPSEELGHTEELVTPVRRTDDDLLEGLKRAQRSRLDDQRGTRINGEMPEFLKLGPDSSQDKENQASNNLPRMLGNFKKDNELSFGVKNDRDIPYCDESFTTDGIIPTAKQADTYFGVRIFGGGGSRPVSHPPVRRNLYSPTLSCLESRLPSLELDLDEAPMSSPRIPAAPDTSSTSLHLPEANYTPPTPLDLDDPLDIGGLNDIRWNPPPPLPPKPKLGQGRGPPPRPPSRPTHATSTSAIDSCTDLERVVAGPHRRRGNLVDFADKFSVSLV